MKKNSNLDQNDSSLTRLSGVFLTIVSSTALVFWVAVAHQAPHAAWGLLFTLGMLVFAFTKDSARIWSMLVIIATSFIPIVISINSTEVGPVVLFGMMGTIAQMASIRLAYCKPSRDWLFYPVIIHSVANILTALFITAFGSAAFLWIPFCSGCLWYIVEVIRVEDNNAWPSWFTGVEEYE